MQLNSNVEGTVISIKDGVKILGISGTVHSFGNVIPTLTIRVGKHVKFGDVIGTSEENALHYETYTYEEKKVKVTDKRKLEIDKVIEIARRELEHYRRVRESIIGMFGDNSSSARLSIMIELNEEVIKLYDEELFYENVYG